MQIEGRKSISLEIRKSLISLALRSACVLAFAVLMTGCAASPHERLEEVGRAVEHARESGAAQWAAEAFASAESLLLSAQREIEEQEARKLPVRRFRIARGLLDDAERQALAARTMAEALAIDARSRAEQAIESANDTIENVRSTWREIPRSADTADDRAGLEDDLAALDTQLAEAAEHLETGAFDAAVANAEAAHARGQKIATVAARSLEHHLSAVP